MATPAVAGFLGFVVAIVFIFYALWKYAGGIDKTISLSNVQVTLWSGVILGSYLSMAVLKGAFLEDVSVNLLALMGVSIGSQVGARAIRAIQEPVPTKKPEGSPAPRTRGLLSQEGNPTELSIAKLQMLAWTLVSLIVFVAIVASNLFANKPELPDVGPGLVVLMGISHAGYVGNKVTDKPADEAAWQKLKDAAKKPAEEPVYKASYNL